jgi:hypothetical protein
MLMYGQLCQNVLHFSWTDMPALTGLSLAADDVHTNWVGQVKLPISGNVTYTSLRIQDITSGPAGPVFTKLITDQGAQDIDTNIVLNTAWKLRFQTGLAGRHNRGRCFIPGVRTGYMTSGFINALGISQWTSPVANLNARFASGGTSPMTLVINRSSGSGPDPINVSNIQLSNTPGSMRSRMIGVGA